MYYEDNSRQFKMTCSDNSRQFTTIQDMTCSDNSRQFKIRHFRQFKIIQDKIKTTQDSMNIPQAR